MPPTLKRKSGQAKPSFLNGRKVILRPLSIKHLKGPYLNWFNDAEVCAGNSHHVYPFTRLDAKEYIDQTRKDKTCLVLAIETKRGKHIGNVALQKIDLLSRNAQCSILIGDKQCWGRGYGEEALRLILDHGFKVLGLERVYAGTFASNMGMQRLAKKLGMKQEGVRRKAHFKDGEFVDVVEFGLLRGEYMKNKRK